MTSQNFLILVSNNSKQIVALYQIKFINDHIKRQNLLLDAVLTPWTSQASLATNVLKVLQEIL